MIRWHCRGNGAPAIGWSSRPIPSGDSHGYASVMGVRPSPVIMTPPWGLTSARPDRGMELRPRVPRQYVPSAGCGRSVCPTSAVPAAYRRTRSRRGSRQEEGHRTPLGVGVLSAGHLLPEPVHLRDRRGGSEGWQSVPHSQGSTAWGKITVSKRDTPPS